MRLLLALFLTGAISPGRAGPEYVGPVTRGELEAPPNREVSGLAASRRDANLLWVHDDSGGKPALYAIDLSGRKLGTLHVRGVANEDWEDVAAFTDAGKAWLLIADTGNNDNERPVVSLHLVEEPQSHHLKSATELTVAPTRTIRVRFEDGARDCESVGVDLTTRSILLLTKRDRPPRLYSIPLDPESENKVTVARLLGPVPHIPQPSAAQSSIKGHLGRRRAEVCGMDVSATGDAAVVVTYGDVLLYRRKDTEPWADVFARTPERLAPHNLVQAEAVCFSPDARCIYVAAEQSRSLVRYDQK